MLDVLVELVVGADAPDAERVAVVPRRFRMIVFRSKTRDMDVLARDVELIARAERQCRLAKVTGIRSKTLRCTAVVVTSGKSACVVTGRRPASIVHAP